MRNLKRVLKSVLVMFVMTALLVPMTFTTPASALASTSWIKLGGSTGGQTIGTNGQTKYYYIDANTTCSNTNNGGSGLTIAAGATVYIYIPANVLLSCTGKAGSGTTGGGAGIWLPSNSKLYIIGNGTIKATGGAAAAGSNGAAGRTAPGTFGTGQEDRHDCLWIASGGGGNGGNGGGGAGAGIGTPGGAGGAGGTGGVGAGENGTGFARFLMHVSYSSSGWNQWGYYQGAAGTAGSNGSAAADMGTLGIQSTITRSIAGGTASSTAGTYGGTGNVRWTDVFYWEAPKCHYRWIAYGGAGGGGGGSGYAAANIGKGGGGAGGGGGGQAGGQAYTTGGLNNEPTSYFGGGGTGYKSGTGSTSKNPLYTDVPAATGDGNLIRYGGTGAGAGTAKAAGTATLAAKVTYNPQNGAATWANNNVTVGLDMPAVTKPTYNGFTFAGWYDDPVGGTQYYNANNASVKKMINYDITLYAHWTTNNNINVANQTQIIEAFKWAPTNNAAITVNLSGNITGFSSTIETVGGSNVILNLNGKTLDLNKHCINVHCTFTIKDSATGGTITNGANAYGGAICAIGGTVILESGTIQNCSATANNEYGGGAVYLNNWGNFTMNGGTIKNCTAVQNAGAVRVRNGSVFTMNGGVIDGCSASYGGGVMMDIGSSVFNMNGGVIQNCTASTCGGGVSAACTFNMSGGVIWNNRVTTTASGLGKGGGIVVGGTTTMTGGYIINNTVNRNAAYGGVGVYGNCTFNMQGGIIWGNKHNGGNSAPSGVGIDNNGRYNKTGGLVDPAINLTLENPLAPIVHIMMKEDITLTDVRSTDGTVLTTADSIDFVGNQNVTWDLNGHTLDLNNYHYILVDAGATFTLKDSGEGGNITNGCAGYYYGSSGLGYSVAWRNWGGAVYVRGGTFNMESGIIQNCNIRHYGGAVGVWKGTFNMSGGIIRNCLINNGYGCGGGVCINTNATFNMSGDALIENCSSAAFAGGVLVNGTSTMTMTDNATIKDCTAASYGGGVYFDSGSKFTMSGGKIINCTAGSSGGGVDSDGIFNMTGGSIEDSTSGTCGGGVYVHSTSTFTMTDAIIKDCTANTYGGGVYVKGNTGKFYMTRSTIEGCKAYYATGGGVDNDAIFTMTDSTIKDCSVTGYGGGIYNYSTGTFTMSGNSAIKNCSAAPYDATWNGRGGAICNIGTFNMENGEISGCTTANETLAAGGVEQSSGTFNMKDGILWGNKNSVTGERNSLYQTGGTLNKTGGYIDPKTVIALNANGGTGGTESVIVYYGDSVMPTLAALPTNMGSSFNGYYDAANGGTKYYNADGSGVSEMTFWDKLDENTTLYAQWTANTYPVTLNNGEGSGETAVTATYGAAMPKVTAPTWDKHVFQGYFTQQGEAYYDANGESVKVWDQDSDSVTLYAHWADSAKIEDLSLELDGDIGMRFHSTVNEEALKTGYMTMSVGGKAAKTQTVHYNETEKDSTGKAIFSFDVSAIELAEKITANFYDENGTLYDTASESVEDYYGLLKEDAKVAADAKAVVKALVNYGHFAQQALSKTRGWVIGSDYAATAKQNDLTATAEDLKAYSPIIIGNDDHVKGIGMSLLLDNKTTLCLYFTTSDGEMPHVRVDGGGELIPIEYDETANVASQYIERMSDGRWLVRIPNIDAVNLGTIHKVTADGRTIYLSALSYGSVITGEENVNVICALYEYYQAALQYAKLQEITSATAQDASYTGSAIEPQLTVISGNTALTESQYEVEWISDRTEVGTHIGIVRAKSGNFVGGALVQFTVKQ